MAFALVGSVGGVSQGASGAAVTPAYGQAPKAGNLLILWVVGQGSATLPAAPSGWPATLRVAGTSCSAALFTRVALGGDAAPTVAAVSGAVLSAQLAEFSGNNLNQGDQSVSATGTTSPIVATVGAADKAAGQLVICVAGAFYSVAATKTLSNTLNNGATSSDTTNNGTSTVDHYCFGWGITTSKASADSDSFSFTTTNITGAAVVIASFKLKLPPSPTVVGQAAQRAAVR